MWFFRRAYRVGYQAGSTGQPYANPYGRGRRGSRYTFGYNKGRALWQAQQAARLEGLLK